MKPIIFIRVCKQALLHKSSNTLNRLGQVGFLPLMNRHQLREVR